MLYCSSECGAISIMQLRTIYCNTHVRTFHVCLCLLALTFVCNSTYLLKLEVQRHDSKQYDAPKALSHGAIFLATCNAILLLSLGRCKIGKYTFPSQFANRFLTYQTFVTNLHLLRVELRCKLPGKLHRVTGPLAHHAVLNHTFELLISINKWNYKQM